MFAIVRCGVNRTMVAHYHFDKTSWVPNVLVIYVFGIRNVAPWRVGEIYLPSQPRTDIFFPIVAGSRKAAKLRS